MYNGFTLQQRKLAWNVWRLHASGTVVGAKCELRRASGTCMTVSASHTTCNTGALVSGVRLERSSRTGWRGEVHDYVCESRTWASISYPTARWRTVETSSSGTASCWKRTTRVADVTHRRRRWIKRTWKILDTLHNHRRNRHRQGWRFPDNTDFSTELSISGKQMEASRKDEFCRPVRTRLASAIIFG